MGEPPDWYRTLKAAQYLKVGPWELAERPYYWTLQAEAAAAAEAYAEEAKKD